MFFKKLLEIAEICFVVFVLTYFTGGLGLGGERDMPGLMPEGALKLIRNAIWGISILLVILNWKGALITARHNKLLWLLTAFILVSFVWSDLLVDTALGNRDVLRMTTFGLYFATRFNLKEQVKLITMTFGIGAAASALIVIGMPSIGKHAIEHPGAWKGIYDYKNTFGSMMVMGSIAFLVLPVENPFDRIIKWLGVAFCTALILLSTSKTALVLAAVMLFLMWFYRQFRWRGKFSVILLNLGMLVGGCIATVLLSNWVELVRGLGRDPTLSGRTYIWSIALNNLWDRPWFGFGRSAFWDKKSPFPQQISHYMTSYVPPHAHNGFLETALDIGLIGLTLFLICFIMTYILALKLAYAAKHSEDLWPLAFLTFLAINNMSESYLLRLDNIYWVLFIVTALTLKQRQLVRSNEPEEARILGQYSGLSMSKEQT